MDLHILLSELYFMADALWDGVIPPPPPPPGSGCSTIKYPGSQTWVTAWDAKIVCFIDLLISTQHFSAVTSVSLAGLSLIASTCFHPAS